MRNGFYNKKEVTKLAKDALKANKKIFYRHNFDEETKEITFEELMHEYDGNWIKIDVKNENEIVFHGVNMLLYV